jgi:hypothetical protein
MCSPSVDRIIISSTETVTIVLKRKYINRLMNISTGSVIGNLSKKNFKCWYLLKGIFFCHVFMGLNRIKLYEEEVQIDLDNLTKYSYRKNGWKTIEYRSMELNNKSVNIVTCKGLAWLMITCFGFDDWVYWRFFIIAVNYNSSHIKLFWTTSALRISHCLECTNRLPFLSLPRGQNISHHVEQLILLCYSVCCHGNLVFSNLLPNASFVAICCS